MSRKRRNRRPVGLFQADITAQTHEGRGITHIDDKVVFVDGALPNETVTFTYQRCHRRYSEGIAADIIKSSSDRVAAKCQHADICGGCSLQHMHPDAQLLFKQGILIEQLKHFGNLQNLPLVEPLKGDIWGYRRKARLGVKYVEKKQKLMLGFREKQSNLLADIHECQVLHPRVASLIEPLKTLISGLSVMKAVPQIEAAVGDDNVALIFRHLEALNDEDKAALVAFAKSYDIHCYCQPGKPSSIYRLWPDDGSPERLSYRYARDDITYIYHPCDFVQVNASMNEKMLEFVINALALNDNDTVLDLFCGLGNFSLPIAKKAGSVVGVEGCHDMVERATLNARHNHLSNTQFIAQDLFKLDSELSWLDYGYNKCVIDPPRSGAQAIIEALSQHRFEKIVYVSCNPATLARDLDQLVNQQGYRLVKTGVMDMFAHTSHIESFAILESAN